MTRGRLLPLALAGLLAGGAGAATDAGANADSQALLQTYQQLLPQLQNNPYGQPLVIRSSESGRRVQGEVFAVLDFAQSLVSDNLDSPAAWCDLMMLPMNTKGCSVTADGALRVYIGKKTAQPLADASRIDFSFQRLRPTADELQIALAAPQGPLGTSDYRITLATVALPQGRSFVHLRYSYQVGLAGQLAFAT